jgi:outer membrane immunogenic protein
LELEKKTMSRFVASVIAGAALCAATGGVSLAADMYVPMKAPPAPPYSWSGCYVGGQAGIVAEQDGWAGADFIGLGFGANSANGYGAVAGGQIGCNYQTGMLVVGIEGDGLWSGVNNTATIDEGGAEVQLTTKNRWDFDVAARVGAAFDRLFIYGKGGIAWGRFDFAETVTGAGTGTANGSATLPGALLGIGMEYAFLPHWTAKIEYNYIAYAQQPVTFTETGLGGISATESFGVTEQLLKIALNYKF